MKKKKFLSSVVEDSMWHKRVVSLMKVLRLVQFFSGNTTQIADVSQKRKGVKDGHRENRKRSTLPQKHE